MSEETKPQSEQIKTQINDLVYKAGDTLFIIRQQQRHLENIYAQIDELRVKLAEAVKNETVPAPAK